MGKKYDYKEIRRSRQLDVYVRPSIKEKVIQKSLYDGISRSQVVDTILENYFKSNPSEGLRQNFDY